MEVSDRVTGGHQMAMTRFEEPIRDNLVDRVPGRLFDERRVTREGQE